jgi:hypothetical protein
MPLAVMATLPAAYYIRHIVRTYSKIQQAIRYNRNPELLCARK